MKKIMLISERLANARSDNNLINLNNLTNYICITDE